MLMAMIRKITMYWKDNYVIYDDSDPQTDYYNAYTLSTKATIDWLKRDGANTVLINYVNPTSSSDKQIAIWEKRATLIARKAGYFIRNYENGRFIISR